MAAAAIGARRDRGGLRASTGGGPVLAPFGDRACALRDGRRADRSRRAHRVCSACRSARRCARAAGLPRSAWGTAVAHFGLGVTLLGIVGATHLGHRADRRRSSPAQTRRRRRYDLTFDGIVHARRARTTASSSRSFTVRRRAASRSASWSRPSAPSRRAAWPTTEAALMTRGVEPALSLARRSQRRRLDRGPALLQAAGAADLARRGGDDARRRAVAVRPAPARRRAEAGDGGKPALQPAE